MGILNWFAKSAPAVRRLPAGSFTVDRHGNLMTTTVGSEYPQWLLDDTAREVLSLFLEARSAQMPLTGLDLNFAGLHIAARETEEWVEVSTHPALGDLLRVPASPSRLRQRPSSRKRHR